MPSDAPCAEDTYRFTFEVKTAKAFLGKESFFPNFLHAFIKLARDGKEKPHRKLGDRVFAVARHIRDRNAPRGRESTVNMIKTRRPQCDVL